MTRALIDHLWQSTLFCAAIWSIALALRTNSAAVRHVLWLLASLKFLVPFSALHFLGAAAGLPTPVESRPTFLGNAIEAATPVISPAITLVAEQDDSSYVLASALLALWIAGALCIAWRWLRGWHAARLLSRAARPAPGAFPGTYITDADIEPSVAGVIHPVVLLPAALLGRLSAAELDAVLAHEHQHIARRDNLKAQVHQLVEILFWFHPLVWFIGRQLREERELACDEAVLARGHDPGEYAAGILAVCRHCAAVHSTQAVAAIAGDLTGRIRQILNGVAPASLGFTKSFLLSIATMLLAAAPLVAGALDDAARRQIEIQDYEHALDGAQFVLTPVNGDGEHARLSITGRQLIISNSSLRELVALAYDVDEQRIEGRGEWFEGERYDVRISLRNELRQPESFEPLAMRTLVNTLLAARFNIEIHVNQQCQSPCGWRALTVLDGAPAQN